MVKELANHHIVTLATYLAGGDSKHADTEDIAMKANEIAPGRFTWRRYKNQINIETVRKRLWDATKEEKGGLLIGSEKEGWLLTENGLRFVKKLMPRLKHLNLEKQRHSQKEIRWLTREKTRMQSESAFQKAIQGNFESITPAEAERFFRIDDYVVGEARKQKLERAKSTFRDDQKFSEILDKLASLVREK